MIVRIPVDVPLPFQGVIAPGQHLEVVFQRVLAIPVDEPVILDPGLPLRTPDLNRPGEDAPLLIAPAVEIAGDHFFGMVLELVKGGGVGIAGDGRPLLADLLVSPQVFGRHIVIGPGAVRAQQDTAEGVKRHRPGEVRMGGHEGGQVAHLRLRGRKRPGPRLLDFRPPLRGEVAVQVKALLLGRHTEQVAIVVLDRALGEDPVEVSRNILRLAADHQARLVGMRLPGAVGVLDPHPEQAAVAINILFFQALQRVFVIGVRARAGADQARLIGQQPFRAVRIDARAHVEGARIQATGDGLVLTVARGQTPDQVQARAGRRHLGSVDVAINPQRRFLLRRPGLEIGDRCQPDITAFVTLAQAFQPDQIGEFLRIGVQKRGKLLVAVEAIESNGRHRSSFQRGAAPRQAPACSGDETLEMEQGVTTARIVPELYAPGGAPRRSTAPRRRQPSGCC